MASASASASARRCVTCRLIIGKRRKNPGISHSTDSVGVLNLVVLGTRKRTSKESDKGGRWTQTVAYTVKMISKEGGREKRSMGVQRGKGLEVGSRGRGKERREGNKPHRRCHFLLPRTPSTAGSFFQRSQWGPASRTRPSRLREARPLATWIAFRSTFHLEPTADQFFCRDGSHNYGIRAHIQVEPKNPKLLGPPAQFIPSEPHSIHISILIRSLRIHIEGLR